MPKSDAAFIGFPPPLLGAKPLRMQVLGGVPGRWLALQKPAGVLAEPHSWYSDAEAIIPALNTQLKAGKAELAPYAIDQARQVYELDPLTTGILVLALCDETTTALRDSYGSGQWEFRFRFIAQRDGGENERTCDLPIAPHRTYSHAVVSHETGKKCQTQFRLIKNVGDYAHWEATSSYLRSHQIRLHAAEVGLPIVCDKLYRGPKPIMLSSLKRNYRHNGEERPLYSELCLHLARISTVIDDKPIVIESPMPKGLAVLCKRLEQHAKE